MKVQGAITKTQTLKGTITKDELLAYVRGTFHVPAHATARFYVVVRSPSYLQSSMQGAPISPLVDVDKDQPLTFMIDWSLPVGETEQG